MWTKTFLKDTAERVIATAVVTFAGAVTGTSALDELDWKVVGLTTGLATLGTLVKCVLASSKGDPQSASLIK